MTTTDIIALIVTIIGVASFATVVTILFRNYIRSAVKEVSFGERDIEIVDLMLYESDENVIRQKKAVSIGKSIVYYAFLAVIIPLFGLSLYSRIKNNVTKIGDQFVMVVASGSMSMKNEVNKYLITNNLNNQFNTYDMITLSSVKNEYQLQVFDVIAYVNDKGINVIHRIIDIEIIDGVKRYSTRGDSNSATDSYKPSFNDVIGKYTNKRIPGIGVFIMFFQSYAGIVTVLSVVYCSLMISHFTKSLDNATDERREKLAKAFDIEKMDINDPELMSASRLNYIYFKDEAYTFDNSGFVSKRDMTEEEKELYDASKKPVTVKDKNKSGSKEEPENKEEEKIDDTSSDGNTAPQDSVEDNK